MKHIKLEHIANKPFTKKIYGQKDFVPNLKEENKIDAIAIQDTYVDFVLEQKGLKKKRL